MCSKIYSLCKQIYKSSQGPKDIVSYIFERVEGKPLEKATFPAENTARYELYTIIDSISLITAMKDYLAKAGEVLANK